MKPIVSLAALACLVVLSQAAHAYEGQYPAQGWVGIAVEKLEREPAHVVDVVANGPASAAGVQVGDRILMIDSAPTATMTLEEIVSRLRGPVGTSVTPTLLSGEDRVDLTILRAEEAPRLSSSGTWARQ